MPPEDVAGALAEAFKREADRHWWIEPRVSLCFAEAIIQLGEACRQIGLVALGTMAKGDALKLLDQRQEAWDLLDQAGTLYLSAGDEMGWARTRIGKLAICVQVNQVMTAMEDAERARAIFREQGALKRLLTLEMNAGIAYDLLGEYKESFILYQRALRLAEEVGDYRTIEMLHNNIGYAQRGLGLLNEANASYGHARTLALQEGDTIGVALSDMNLASVAQLQGQYRTALSLLEQVIEPISSAYPSISVSAHRDLVRCLLSLNRYNEAVARCEDILAEQHGALSDYDHARALLYLSIAHFMIGNLEASQGALDVADTILIGLKAWGWLGELQLLRAQIAFRHGDAEGADASITIAEDYLSRSGHELDQNWLEISRSEIALARGEYQNALTQAALALQRARKNEMTTHRYSAHLLLGRIHEARNERRHAQQHYTAAAAALSRAQRSLILTYRSEFLADKQDAQRALMRMALEDSDARRAFLTLEYGKAQVWMSYLSQREQLRWLADDNDSRPLIDEMARLRREHHWYFRIAYDRAVREQQPLAITSEEAAQEVSIRERALRSITERLYLRNRRGNLHQVEIARLQDIQAKLAADDALMIAYYNDGNRYWGFLLDGQEVTLIPLGSAGTVGTDADKLLRNIDRAATFAQGSVETATHVQTFQGIAHRLYQALLAPFAIWLQRRNQVVIVPYSRLHYLPFHLLWDGNSYFGQDQDVVILPAASLITRTVARRPAGVLALSHSWDGRLNHTREEATCVTSHLGGASPYHEGAAKRELLSHSPCQVLHIAAHGQFRIDQPDFSYLNLDDGQLYIDDLFQHDLSYELVTLSACETARSQSTAGDETIGLGRGFLFAGAGALIASLWRVNDAYTVQLMDSLYRNLKNGATKAAALRQAQFGLLAQQPGLHPAYWGAFELIGNADPPVTLSATV